MTTTEAVKEMSWLLKTSDYFYGASETCDKANLFFNVWSFFVPS